MSDLLTARRADSTAAPADRPAPAARADHAVPSEFEARHIGLSAADERQMLDVVGAASLPALIAEIVPESIARHDRMDLPAAATEAAALAELKQIAARNRLLTSFIGQGYHGTHTPGVILRNILENPAWYTAYTPYQAEISQGRMEALVNFQTMVCDLTSMPIANASMLDEATAAAEAMTLARRSAAAKSPVFFADRRCHPQTLEVLATRARPLGIELVVGDVAALIESHDCFGALIQYPATDGGLDDPRGLADRVHARQALLCVAADPLALVLLAPPGEWGADIVVGSTQRFGMPMGCGGPHAAYLACRDDLKRSLPGRLVGVSIDAHGGPAYRLALQTREQHIRREKATSNICTAQVLPAVVASMYAVYHGPGGLTRIADRVARLTATLAAGLGQLGVRLRHAQAFDTLSLDTGNHTAALAARARDAGMNLRTLDAGTLTISLDETTTAADVARLWSVFAAAGQPVPDLGAVEREAAPLIPPALRRSSEFLVHPVFQSHHSETAMLRYIRSLSDRDLALDRSMIPLGSCTMKLNATSEMIPITWPEFAHVHPFAPAEQRQGYAELETLLRRWLTAATGYAGISLQPNAGSQGEYAGLLAIQAWQRSRGQGQRDVCIIPASAHGTNPASAQMVGMQVVVTGCDAQGNVDLAELEAKCRQHADRLAAVMITYPSTHGVFETSIRELCDIVHRHGGRVYVDGANMNALVGLAAPGRFGGDVSHLNLHKTFCIPHGGGGPGVGPVCVVEDLVPFLPGHAAGGLPAGDVGAVSAAPLGNAAVLPISWMYCRMMGPEGLVHATEAAILAANYVSVRLRGHFPTLYAGAGGRVAHECILDLRPLKETSGVTAEDVAKRLIDYGFHAPTLSFPVPGTLMVEPTESEPLAELDRFVEAMIAIRAEIARIEAGEWPEDDNPLKHAPHTAATVAADAWPHAYSRETAAFPLASLRRSKYWPPVGRVDNVHGDRNLFCSCVPVAAWDEPAAAPPPALTRSGGRASGCSDDKQNENGPHQRERLPGGSTCSGLLYHLLILTLSHASRDVRRFPQVSISMNGMVLNRKTLNQMSQRRKTLVWRMATLAVLLGGGWLLPVAGPRGAFAQAPAAASDGRVLPFPAVPSASVAGETIQDSTMTWRSAPKRLRDGAPNVLVVLIDDTGFGHADTFGGECHTPTLTRLWNTGIAYNAFHTTSICSPTRAALLTGRNHHRVGNGTIAERASDFDGYTGIIPRTAATIPEVLHHYGYTSAAFGKWHNTPANQTTAMGPFDRWPTGHGFDFFYGFLAGETSQYEPRLYENTTPREPHGKDYHLSEDMADRALTWLKKHQAFAPDKPFFLYWAPGAVHGPHHVNAAWADKYRGRFDDGWDAYRERVYARQKQLGWIPQTAKLTPRDATMPAWEGIPGAQRPFQARLMEIYAGFVEHTDHQVGRLVDGLEQMGLRENTIIFYVWGDNGPSAEGQQGTISELLAQNNIANTIDQQLTALDGLGGLPALGGPRTDNMYHAGWAWAGATPFRSTKLVAAHFGGTRNPLVVSWPQGIKPDRTPRRQFHHVNDIAPTLYELLGVTPPQSVNGFAQDPIDGMSMAYTFADAGAAGRKKTQYFENNASRGIYHDGWFAGTFGPFVPWDTPSTAARLRSWVPGNEAWQIYDLSSDFTQADDLSASEGPRLESMKKLFLSEAKANKVLPIGGGLWTRFHPEDAVSSPYRSWVFDADTTRMPEFAAPAIGKRSNRVEIDVEVADSADGVLYALGGASGGVAVYLDQGQLVYEYNMLVIERTTVRSPQKLAAGKHTLEVSETIAKPGAPAEVVLTIDGKEAARTTVKRTVPGAFTASETLDVGTDLGSPVSTVYFDRAPFAFEGTIGRVKVELR